MYLLSNNSGVVKLQQKMCQAQGRTIIITQGTFIVKYPKI